MEYRLLTYRSSEGPRAGIFAEGKVFDLARATGRPSWHSVLAILDDWAEAEPLLEQTATGLATGRVTMDGLALAAVELSAPLLYPRNIYAAGGNYIDHIEKMFKVMNIPRQPTPKERGENPWHFVKPTFGTVVGPNARVALPAHSAKVDWEIELAAVIGKRARNVPVDEALQCVAAYTIANDLSARDNNTRKKTPTDNPFFRDMLGGKGFDGSCPMGPWLVPAKEIPDPQDLGMKLWVNDELMQDSNSSQMVFSTAEQIAMLSSRITLHPGDVVLTGTPAGTGMESSRFLKGGDTVRLWINSIGEMTHTVV
ncbi:MAG TPA: fumarylacetoacetate hydrolase family protein [Ramlibacter sp.]|nr:fumarylacetoacetate hydrolase family protein [Ramlibacter sp.]